MFQSLSSTPYRWVVNILVVSSIYNQCSESWDITSSDTFYTWRSLFTYVFAFESALKLHAFGYDFWTLDPWCRFERHLVAISLLDELGFTRAVCWLLHLSPYLAKLVGSAQALRTLRLVQHARELQKLITTILLSIPSLVNVSLLAAAVAIESVLIRCRCTLTVSQHAC